MNFFEHQDKARKQTGRLVMLFILAVTVVVLSTAVVISGVVAYFLGQSFGNNSVWNGTYWHTVFTSPAFAYSALGTLTLIILGSAYKSLQLGGNGIAVALSLDGKHVHPDSSDPAHQKLLNIVTEMALASGNPVPKVFLLPGDAINAFAAGYNRHQTVVAVTQGALTQLNRDELQGVIAHEFSHINFGDVKINMRLVALLHGILLIGEIGRLLPSSGGSRSRSNNKNAGLGVALMAIGYSGTFLGNLIKAAVSRQREFLADASAVQFTRNPEGIASALNKIAHGPNGGSIVSSRANIYKHFYFSAEAPYFFSSLLATHPAITERIKRLGYATANAVSANANNTHKPQGATSDHLAGFTGSANHSTLNLAIPPNNPTNAVKIINSIGQPSATHLHNAQTHIAQLPESLKKATHNAFSARALVYGLIIHHTPSNHHAAQWQYLQQQAHPQTYKTLEQLLPLLQNLNTSASYHLLLMAEAALQDQSPTQAAVFKRCAKALIKADNSLTLFEWSIYRLAVAPLERQAQGRKKLTDCQQALSLLFYYALSHCEPGLRAQTLLAITPILGFTLPTPAKISLQQLDTALVELRQLKPLSKPTLLKALMVCLQGDGVITDEELTLIRMTALLLDCPIPDISLPN